MVFGVDLSKDPFDVGFNEGPCALVFRFFLTPDNFCVFEAFQFLNRRLRWERIELFNAQQVDVIDPTCVAFFEQVVVNLARTHNDPLDLVIFHQRGVRVSFLRIIPHQAVEGGSSGKVLGVGNGHLVT